MSNPTTTTSSRKTGLQVELFLFCRPAGATEILFLLLKRTPERGGSWQPMTGGNEYGETLLETVVREAGEELGLVVDPTQVIDTGFEFSFTDNGATHSERVFGYEVAEGTSITLSKEHTDLEWLPSLAAHQRLKWDGNKRGLAALLALISTSK